MSVLNQSGEEQVECPLCMEPLEVDDLNFFPCTCGYQICRFCWHRIRTDENGLCPACRKGYPENPADFKPLSQEEVAKLKAEKRHKDQQRKQKITENRKHLANVRVVQRNLVFVVGLPMRLADSEVLKKHEYFGKFGKIHKVVINQCTSYAGTQGPSASAYVTYQRADDALRAIQAVNNISVDGRSIKSSLGTTKYCSHFMKNQACPKPDCMYLHDQGDPEASFTKEEMQQGKHQEYEKKLHDALISATAAQRDRKPTPSPPATGAVAPSGDGKTAGAATAGGGQGTCAQQAGKEAWPSLQPGATGNGISNGVTAAGSGKGENGRKQSVAKNPNVAKKRHSSGDENRGKTKDKQPYSSDDADALEYGDARDASPLDDDDEEEEEAPSFETRSTSESASLDSSDEGVRCDPRPPPTSTSAARLAAAMAGGRVLFEPDNNSSFFSTNNFTKVAASAHGSGGLDWQLNGLSQTHMPDMMLPTAHPSEDWQAAFSNLSSDQIPDPAAHLQQQQQQQQQQARTNNEDDVRNEQNQTARSADTQNKFILDEFGVGESPPGFGDTNPGHMFSSLHSQYAVHDAPPQHYMVNRHQFHGARLPNGLPQTQATSKFFSDYHMRHPVVENNYAHLDPSNYGAKDPRKGADYAPHMTDGGGGFQECGVFGGARHFPGHGLNGVRLRNGDVSEESDVASYQTEADEDEKYFQRKSTERIGGEFGYGGDGVGGGGKETADEGDGINDDCVDWGFDLFQETQKALAEMMEKETSTTAMGHGKGPSGGGGHYSYQHVNSHMNNSHMPLPGYSQLQQQQQQQQQYGGSKMLAGFSQQQQLQQIQAQQNHRVPSGPVSGCSRLLDGLGLGPSPPRTRLPPPGFSTAPNHMNAFGLGIPRAPTNTGSKILPFMGMNSTGGGNGSLSPVPQQNPQQQSMLFPPPSPGTRGNGFGLTNGMKDPHAGAPPMQYKDWSENLRGLIPFAPPPNTSSPPPTTAQHNASHYNTQQQGNVSKGWTGPCTDWTALDPAIVSSSRPAPHPTSHPPPPNPLLLQQHNGSMLSQQQQTSHWLRQLEEHNAGLFFGGQDWASSLSAAPPPGFTIRQQSAGVGDL